MDQKRTKWWLIPIAILLALVLLAALFWDTISIYLMPKAALNYAIAYTISELENRYQDSPLPILAEGISPDGQSTLHLELDTENAYLGSVRYNMTVQTQLAPKRILAKGIATTAGKALDLSLFLDENFAAVSSDGLLSGGFYGITYDTFSQDIRSSTLLSLLAGENAISQWESSISKLQGIFAQPITVPQWELQDLFNILNGISLLKAQVSQETVELTDGPQDCYRILFQVTGSKLRSGLEFLDMELPVTIDDSSLMTIAFYLYNETVVKCEVSLTGREAAVLSLYFGSSPRTDDLQFALYLPEESHQVTISQDALTVNGQTVRYTWNAATGALTLITQNGTAAMTLKETGNGFQLQTSDFEALAALLTEGDDKADSKCTMLVTKGSDFDTPEYKNFCQWSLEDTLSLLRGLGGLFGLSLPQT